MTEDTPEESWTAVAFSGTMLIKANTGRTIAEVTLPEDAHLMAAAIELRRELEELVEWVENTVAYGVPKRRLERIDVVLKKSGRK